jgi:tRNA-dihydrouridine synthase 2
MSIYLGKVICAPMVRVSHLPFRMFCAEQGADVVFSEEIVAAKLQHCVLERRDYAWPSFEAILSPGIPPPDVSTLAVDEFVTYEAFKNSRKRSIVFQTVRHGEGCPIVLQLGAADPHVAARAALVVCEHVDGIDVNMGCPKKFSVQNGMGAALMTDPQRAGAILKAVNEAVNSPERVERRGGRRVPISFKTRLFHEVLESVSHLSGVIAAAGGPSVVHAVTLHCRTRDMRSETTPMTEHAAAILQQLRERHADAVRGVCFVLNGSVECRQSGLARARALGFDACMLARHAMWDPRAFDANYSVAPGGFEHTDARELARIHLQLLRRQVALRTMFQMVKYHVTRSFQELGSSCGKELAIKLVLAKSYAEIATLLGASAEEVASRFSVRFAEELVPDSGAASLATEAAPSAAGESSTEPQRKYQRCESPQDADDTKPLILS